MLNRSDVVGRRITRVLQTPWATSRREGWPDVHWCDTFVQLDSGLWILLEYTEDEDAPLPIMSRTVDTATLVPSSVEQACVGLTIDEVAISTLWGSLGLLLSNGSFLHVDTDGDTVSAGLTRIRPIDHREDFLTYWGRQTLPQWEHLQEASQCKSPIYITDERWADRILSLTLFGGFLSVLLWALLTQMHPVAMTAATLVYYGLIAVVSLLLAALVWRNSLFRTYTVDETQIVEITSFWKLVQWQKPYSHQDVPSIEVTSWRSGFPVSHAWYGMRLRLGNERDRMLLVSRDKERIETLTAQINEVWSKRK